MNLTAKELADLRAAEAQNLEDEEMNSLDDFESFDLEDVADADHSYIKGMWGSFRSQEGTAAAQALADDILIAHGMVQSFVNAFARDGRYVVVFDPTTATAGTDMKTKFVAITPAPIADPSLTAEEAGLVLTALATHEISHPRYGRMTAQAVEKVFFGNPTAQRLSNLLDDIRIERRFVADYPGYAGIFQPALDYIGRAGQEPGAPLRVQKLSAPINLAIAATRYPAFSDWSDQAVKAEHDWWCDWAARGSREDAPKRHVDFIREALEHIAENYDPVLGDDSQLNKVIRNRYNNDTGEDKTDPASSCSGASAVDKAAIAGGTDSHKLSKLKENADEILEAARNTETDGHGSAVDVNRSLRGITGGGPRGVPSAVAARHIRSAILQSRTGHTDHAPFKRHGRLDQRGIARVAKGDFRLFEKRTAPSVGRYNVWVMVDASDSMVWGYEAPLQKAAGVAHAMAVASQSVPTVRMSLWAWTSPFRHSSPADAGVALAWKTGMSADQALRLSTVKTGSTPDSVVMGWAGRAILRDTASDETPVVIFISDGAGYGEMNRRVAEARKAGVEVYGVSFASGMTAVDTARFGRGHFVPWQGSIEETARPLARLFARITGGKR